MSFDEALKARAAAIEAHLVAAAGDPPCPLSEAMRYAASGGKRLRGFLVMESAALHGVPDSVSIHAAAAIEAIHAYSLVHDDLPCMDDDDLRRGQPTVHVRWDEATAVLVGDGLQSLAFRLVTEGDLPAERRLALARSLAREAAAMVRGQALDIRAETAAEPLDLAGITELQSQKTGALIEWSAMAGAVMADADPAPLAAYARALGLAFQIVDDILDETGDEAKAGKRLNKDADAGKATFVSLLGLDGAMDRAQDLAAEAVDALSLYDARADNLRQAAMFVVSREF